MGKTLALSYYDGHVPSGLSGEELEKAIEEERKKCEEMTEWEDI